MIFKETYRQNNNWKHSAIGEPRSADHFVGILKGHIYF